MSEREPTPPDLIEAKRLAQEASRQAREARRHAHRIANEARRSAEVAKREAIRAARPARSQLPDIQVSVGFGSRSVMGALFAVVGAAFFAESIGLWDFKRVYLWPMLLIAMGLAQLLGRTERQKVEKERTTRLAVAEERVKIARELHDIVAHSVSLMTIQISAARRVFHKTPAEAEKALEAAERTGRESLTELRSILNVLRSSDASIERSDPPETAPLPGLADIPKLVGSVRQAGTAITFDVRGEPSDVTPSIAVTFYRVLQEALTNVIRHAPGAAVNVQIGYEERRMTLVVEDDGPGSEAPGGEGHGLIGMQERVGAAGGSLQVGPARSGKGWRVEASIPVRSP